MFVYAKPLLYGRCGRSSNFSHLIASTAATAECGCALSWSKRTSWTANTWACCELPAADVLTLCERVEYVYVCMYVCVCVYIYIYIYRERERERERIIARYSATVEFESAATIFKDDL